jgi:predicted small lipoprotein YifL
MKTVAWMLVACGSLVIAGCGQKGALYLPDKNASVVTRPAGGAGANNPAATQPAPAPSQQPQDKDKSDDDSKPK